MTAIGARTVVVRLGVATAMASLAACASATGVLYSDARLAELTAPQFGVSPSQITIQNRRPTGSGSYYDVKLPSGDTVRCFHDGNVLGMGIASNPPRCGAQVGQHSVLGR